MELRIFTEPQQGATHDDLLRVARATEELGFDAFFRSDHYLAMGEGNGLPGPTDAWIT
ncbi:MAG: LLM class F420-dependent oxidoreductase, partial [Allobranchiibius sp.]